MVQIHRKSIKVTKEFLETPLYGVLIRSTLRQDFMEMLSNIDFDLVEFPAADGSVELVAEVVTMTKQDYDEIMLFLKGIWSTGSMDHSALASKIIEKITGRYPRAGA